MTSVTLQVGAEYATGTTVSVYNTVNSVPVSPVGSVVTTGTVGSDGNVTFSGLTVDKNYLAYAASGSPQYVRFYVPSVNPSSGGSGVPSGGTTGQVLAKISNTDSDAGWGDTASLSNDLPLVENVAAAGTSTQAARSDHVHPAVGSTLSPANVQSLIAWSFDPAATSLGNVTAAAIVFGRILISTGATATSLVGVVNVAGVTLTASQNKGALWNAAGVLIAETADQSSAWTSTGTKTMALTAETGKSLLLTPGVYFAGMMSNGTTRPQFGGTANASSGNIGLSGTGLGLRQGYVATATALPDPLSPLGGTTQIPWFALA